MTRSHHSAGRTLISLLLALMLAVSAQSHAQADGGRLLSSVRSNGFLVTIFAAPDPPRAGLIDVSVLLQNDSNNDPNSAVSADAEIAVTLRSTSQPDLAVSAPATRSQATNKLLQSALIELPHAGVWNGTIHCVADGKSAAVSFELNVAEATPPWRSLAGWILWPVVALALFIVHRRLAIETRKRSR
jgi:hypothetical protein